MSVRDHETLLMSLPPHSSTNQPDYAWEIATLFPQQGDWSEAEFLAITDSTNRLIELTKGQVEFLAMPTELHQAILEFLFDTIRAFVKPRELGQVRFAPLRVRTGPGTFRDPDIVFLRNENYHKRSNRFWSGADLVVEVVSDDPQSRKRDYEQKPIDYAKASIGEYWIVDPQERRIIVLILDGTDYRTHGEFAPGQIATSASLEGFGVDVAAIFAAGDDTISQAE